MACHSRLLNNKRFAIDNSDITADADADKTPQANADAHVETQTNADADADTNAHCHADTNADAYQQRAANADAHAIAPINAEYLSFSRADQREWKVVRYAASSYPHASNQHTADTRDLDTL